MSHSDKMIKVLAEAGAREILKTNGDVDKINKIMKRHSLACYAAGVLEVMLATKNDDLDSLSKLNNMLTDETASIVTEDAIRKASSAGK